MPQHAFALQDLVRDTFAAPLHEKLQYALERGVSLFATSLPARSRRPAKDQRPDSSEFIRISKDHLHGVIPSRSYPRQVEQHKPLLQSFTKHGHACGLVCTLAVELGLEANAFALLDLFDLVAESLPPSV
ncbi:b7a22100-53fb-483f-9eac-6a609b4cf28b [Thermothielavioides terrestris]|uniref:B7a22100-53fb-483f-9eac-6a609b4cf28b n=1 Tax=Thermothielavioides terrestris TaxID=2587410 RepID=A0A446B924_9PEZI|nr:b7a22100-53fb-483f-9eac-6a609b4cf28b [Thermothielavioides terrestris]